MSEPSGLEITRFEAAFRGWSDEVRLRFLEQFSHELTIAIRAVWSDEELSDAEKVERIKWINEIHHRVAPKASAIRRGVRDETAPESWLDLQHWVAQNEAMRPLIEHAVRYSTRHAP